MKTFLKRFKYIFGLGLAGLIVFSTFLTFFVPPQQASADHVSGTWQSNEVIRINGIDYRWTGQVEGNFRYTATANSGNTVCDRSGPKSFIEFAQNPTAANNPASPGFLDVYTSIGTVEGGFDECGWNQNHRVNLGNTAAAKTNEAQAQCANQPADRAEDCIRRAAVAACSTGTPDSRDACVAAYIARNAAPDSGQIGSNPDDTGEPDPELDCDVSPNPLTWILCPVVKGLNYIIAGMDNAITSMLTVEQDNIFDRNTPSGAAYYSAWQAFRGIALGILVIAALAMIVGQALGFEILDAYTVKKVLPRLIVAIIGISLSWQLLEWFVGLTNDLGLGIRQLIYYPFTQGNVGGNDAILGGGEATASAIILLLSSPALIGLGIYGLLLYGGTALLAIGLGFLVLIFRQLVIVVLIMFAPVAIACYVLPNTNGVWKLWYESFTKALLMFPIIMAFLAVGRVVALTSSGPDATTVGQLVAVIAYIAPYFLIPLTFRFAGGALRTLGGFVNDKSRGAFDSLKNQRKERSKDRRERAKSESLWDNNSVIGKRANKLASWATDPGSNLAVIGANKNIPGLRKRGARVLSQIEHAKVAQSGKLFEELNKAGYNDRAYRALSGSHREMSEATQERLKAANLFGKTPTSLQDLQSMSHILAQGDDNERIAASAIEGSMGRLATLYQDGDMTKASIQAAGIMGLASHGFADGEDLEKVGNDLQKDGGRGYAQSVISQAQVMGARSRPDIKAGYGVVYRDGQFHNGISADGGRAESLLKTLGAQDMAGAKGGAFDALAPTIKKALDEGAAPGATPQQVNTATAVREQLFQWASPYSAASVDIKTKALSMIQAQNAEVQEAFRKQVEEEARQRERSGIGGAAGGGDAGGGGAAGGGST